MSVIEQTERSNGLPAPSKVKTCSFPWQQMIIDPSGDVTPCCYFHAYTVGGLNSALGNTNVQTIREIWNGPQYRKLRSIHASGEIPEDHPCNNCMTFQINNSYPTFEMKAALSEDEDSVFRTELSESTVEELSKASRLSLLEDGVEVATAPVKLNEIRKIDNAAFSILGSVIHFVTADRSPPILNGRAYALRIDDQDVQLPEFGYDQSARSAKNLKKAYSEYLSCAEEMEATPTHLGYASSVDCNLDCDYCSQNEQRAANLQLRDRTLDDVKEILPDLIYFVWAGGEPFFLKPFREFINQYNVAINPNLLFGFTSNGTMITKQQFEKLKTFPRISASVSIDSFVPESYEKLRSPAKFDRVIGNYQRLQEPENRITWQIQCGMLVMKANVEEIDRNVQFAIDNGIELNLSPILQYPVTERLDFFSNFDAETLGWKEAIDRAIEINRVAGEEGRLPQNMGGALEVVRGNFKQASVAYSQASYLDVEIVDPNDVLTSHRRPGLIVGSNAYNPIGYLDINQGAGNYRLYFRPQDIETLYKSPTERIWTYYHNLVEPWHSMVHGHIDIDNLKNPVLPQRQSLLSRIIRTFGGKGKTQSTNATPTPDLVVQVPNINTPPRPRNATLSHAGQASPDGNFNIDGTQIHDAIRRRELEILRQSTKSDSEIIINFSGGEPDGGYCFTKTFDNIPCSSDLDGFSPLHLLEDDIALFGAHSSHDAIRSKGKGRFSHWGNVIYFSSSDGSDPRKNGRTYTLTNLEQSEVPSIGPILLKNFHNENENDHCFYCDIDWPFPSDIEAASDLVIFEDGKPLTGPHSMHDAIRNLGGGRYSHWGERIYFSASDNSDPTTNGRKYELFYPGTQINKMSASEDTA